MNLLLLACTLAFGAWTYGFHDVPQPSSEIASGAGSTLVVRDFPGDRMFSTISATYDRTTLALQSATEHASCCGSSSEASVELAQDGSYDISAQRHGASGDYTEHLRNYRVPRGGLLLTGGMNLIPWIYAKGRATQIYSLAFDPIRMQAQSVNVAHVAFPGGVPSTDAVLGVSEYGGTHTTYLWYDPCTFVVDAYGPDANRATVRTALLK